MVTGQCTDVSSFTTAVPDKNKLQTLAIFLKNAWFTLCRNINDQNNRYSVHAFHEVSFPLVSVCKIIGHNFSKKNIQTKMLN